MKKRFLAMFVTICMIITLLPFTAFAAEEDLPGVAAGEDEANPPAGPDDTESEAITGDGYSFEESSGKLTVTTNEGTVNWRNDKVVGPQAIKSVDLAEGVTDIGQAAFALCKSLTEVTFPAGLQTIGAQAFALCMSLTEVALPDGLNAIGEQAFSNCSGLTAFSVNADNQSFESADGVLYNKGKSMLLQYPMKKSGDSFDVPEGVTAIVEAAFAGCEFLTEVALPVGLKTIGPESFSDCVNLANVTFPAGLETIGAYAFYNCANLTNVILPTGLETIGEHLFGECTNLAEVTFPESLKTIEGFAFRGCVSLRDVVFPAGLETIGDNAFFKCEGLTEAAFPESLKTIGNSAFSACIGLMAFSVDADNPNFESADGVLYNKGKSTLLQYPMGKSGDSFDVPAGVTVIENYAFYQCSSLTEVTFPESLKTIEQSVFSGCVGLTEVTFPGGLETISNSAFRDCAGLTIVTFMSDTPPYIDPYGFAYISSPGTIIYPSGAGGYTEDWKNTCLSAWTLAPAYRLTVKNGTDATNAGLYRENETVEITADTAPSGQVFDLWTTEDGGSFADVSGTSTTFTMPAAHATVTANYKSDHMHSFGTDWKSDDTNHWHECIANDGFKASEAAHSGGTANCHAKRLCEICKAAYGGLNPDNHDGKTEVKNAVAATEDREGYSGDTYCLGCSVKLETGHTVPKLEHTHSMTKTEAKAATHTEDGNIEYYTCSKCGKLYKDAKGTQEITLADTVIKATGHKSDDSGWKADSKKHWHACSCGEILDSAAHNFKWITDKTATATEKGSKHEECTVCGYKKAAVEIPATGTSPKPADKSAKSDKSGTSGLPKTGDNSSMFLWICLLLASGGAVTALGVVHKKRKTRGK